MSQNTEELRQAYRQAEQKHGEAVAKLAAEQRASGGQDNPVLSAAREQVRKADEVRGDAIQNLARAQGQDV